MLLIAAGTVCLAVFAMLFRAVRLRTAAANAGGAGKRSDLVDTVVTVGLITLMVSGVSLIVKGFS
jgi:hypothetical protein